MNSTSSSSQTLSFSSSETLSVPFARSHRASSLPHTEMKRAYYEFCVSFLTAALLILSCAGGTAFCAQKPEFVLVHGASHGAWCWYKVRAILENSGYKSTVIDLVSNGRDGTDANTVTSIEQYAKPLIDHLARVDASDKVILVAHSLGGVSISYAMEKHPEKISKAIYVAALLQGNNQSAAETFPPGAEETWLKNQILLLHQANGPIADPTSFRINDDIRLASKYLYNHSPDQDIYLAVSMLDWTPYAALSQKLMLSPERYGRVPRYYIVTGNDALLDAKTYQEARVKIMSGTKAFYLEKSDHSPFFSMPSELCSLLFTISSA